MNQRQPYIPILALLCVFFILGVAYSSINPLYEATDELRHYRYVRYLATEQKLPVQGEERCRSQSHHPPLFYLLAAAATASIDTGQDICYTPTENQFWAYRYWEVGQDNKAQYLHDASEQFPWHGAALAAHIARFVNLLLGTAVVALCWLIGIEIWPQNKTIAWLAAIMVAFNPMFLYMSGSINNDIIAALTGTAVVYALVYLSNPAQKLNASSGTLVGILFSAALLSKFNLAAILLPIQLLFFIKAYQEKNWRGWFLANLTFTLSTILLTGWWFWRNQQLYGEPTGIRILTELWGVRNPQDSFSLALSELPYAWTTLWGRFGFGQIPLPDTIYRLLKSFVTIGLLGGLIPFIKQATKRKESIEPWTKITILLLQTTLSFLVLFNYMLVSPAGPMGRFFFPGLPTLTLLVSWGYHQIIELLLQKQPYLKTKTIRQLIHTVITLSFAALALFSLTHYLYPAYAKPERFTESTVIPNPVAIQFDSLVLLRGYEFTPDQLTPGAMGELTLYWEVIGKPLGNYLLFVHVTDQLGLQVTQRDTHPGLGNFPTSQWEVGDRFIDTIPVHIPQTAYAPESLSLSIGLYAPTYRLAIQDTNGEFIGDSLPLIERPLEPNPALYPNVQAENFNNQWQLLGYTYDKRELNNSEQLELTLYWHQLNETNHNNLLIELFSENNQLLTSWESSLTIDSFAEPKTGMSRHTLDIPPDLPTGTYKIHVSLIDITTNQRENRIGEDGHWIDNHLILAPIRVLVKN